MLDFLDARIFIEEKDDGRYKIITVSTAAVPDRENETFSIEAIDFDIQRAKETGEYPEYRMFHKPYLAIGKVEKMYRVGIFAVDEGTSYSDPFSLSICKELLSDNSSKWRVSRGFYVLEASGGCPDCGESLLIRTKHMIAGFKCPQCDSLHMSYKGVLDNVHFRKTRTFDDTITDIPCVPYTGVTAHKYTNNFTESEVVMNKKELKEKLMESGIEEELIDERMKSISEKQLERMDDLPFAQVLKELEEKEEDQDNGNESGDDEFFVLDPEVLKDFSDIVEVKLKEIIVGAFDGAELEVPDIEMKEIPGIEELKESIEEIKTQVSDITEALGVLLDDDEARLKELMDDMPRGARLRIKRYKCDDKEDEEEDEEENGPSFNTESKESDPADGVVLTADGEQFSSMSEAVR